MSESEPTLADLDRHLTAIDRDLVSYDRRFAALDERLSAIDERLGALDSRIVTLAGQVAAGFEAIGRRLDTLTDSIAELGRLLLEHRHGDDGRAIVE